MGNVVEGLEASVRNQVDKFPDTKLVFKEGGREELAEVFSEVAEIAQKAADSALIGTEEGDLEFGVAAVVYAQVKDQPLIVGLEVLG